MSEKATLLRRPGQEQDREESDRGQWARNVVCVIFCVGVLVLLIIESKGLMRIVDNESQALAGTNMG
eukprot:3349565-Rhodomonas_salina.1